MGHQVALQTSHPAVQALVEPWLREARLCLDVPLTLVVEVGPLPDIAADSRPVFQQGRVAIWSGAGGPVRLDWEPGLGRATFADKGTSAHVTVTEHGLERPNELLRSFLLNVCILLLRRAGLHHVHGATLRDPRGRGWLLVGVSQSGKSTTTALLARRGWAIGTDDIAFFGAGSDASTTDVVAWRERLALRDDAVASAGYGGGTEFTSRRKTGWFPEELGAEWVGRVTPELLAFPTVRADRPSAVTPLRAADALTRLMQCSPWVALESDLASEHLRLMTQLAKQARAFDLSLGRDLFDRPDTLLELVA